MDFVFGKENIELAYVPSIRNFYSIASINSIAYLNSKIEMPLRQNQHAFSKQDTAPLQAYAGSHRFSWTTELRHILSRKFSKIIWWPLFKIQQRWFTNSPFMLSCREMREFDKLWATIQKGAFAYNNLFLGLSPFRRHDTDLADITTLALFFGDEFIDGLAAATGKPFIQKLIEDNDRQFHLHKKLNGKKVSLQYRFRIDQLLPPEILNQHNKKYDVSYQKFYQLLHHFLYLMNEYLGKLSFEKANKVADRIAESCNTCVASFLHDVHDNSSDRGHLNNEASVLHFHESKTAYMQEKLLELRCTLADKEQAMFSVQIPGWLDVMRVVQIYDDIQDMIIDDGLQDNLVLSTAYHYFPSEWSWFCSRKNKLKLQNEQHLLLSLYMPCSLQHCMQLAADKIKTMNWEQQKVMHYLLLKNKYLVYRENFFPEDDFLFNFYWHIKNKMDHLSVESIKSFVVDTCTHLKETRRGLLKNVDPSTAYQLRYNLFLLSHHEKALILDKVIIK